MNKILYLHLLYTKCFIQLFFEYILKKKIITGTCYQ